MTRLPTFDDIFAVMSAASVGDNAARVVVPEDPPLDDLAMRFAIAVNLLLDDLAFRAAEAEAAHRVTQIELERIVAERTLKLANANQELEAFSYSVAHDLRAPLRSIDGFSQALLEDYADKIDAEGSNYLQLIRESAQQMGQLIDDLLTLSRVSQSELRYELVDLTALARSVLTRLQKNEPKRKVELIISEGLMANGDARFLGIVLENLLGNAWKFTGMCPMARIEVSAQQEKGRPVFFVRDNGAGFDMAYAHKLFGVFQRLHSAAEFEGTGIGLAIVQRIVRRHSGRVWAEGEVGRGATVYFTLNEEVQWLQRK
jgi:light-regulated signal transduction histidine kinase (bacteriophytochrome)